MGWCWWPLPTFHPRIFIATGCSGPASCRPSDLIERHCEVLNVDGGIDYRLRTLEQAEIITSRWISRPRPTWTAISGN